MYECVTESAGAGRAPLCEQFFCRLVTGAAGAREAADPAREFPRGTVLFEEGQAPRGVYVICGGRVKLFNCSGDARVLITDIAGPGDVLGLSAVVSGAPYEGTAEALEECRLFFVGREEFLRLLDVRAGAWAQATRLLSRSYRMAHRQASVLGLSTSAAGKLASVLLEHPSLRGGRVGRGVKFKLTLTHEEIGHLIGASRETVTRLLNEFRRKRLIEVSGETLSLCDRAALEALAPPC